MVRKIVAVILAALVLFFAAIAILGIWGFIDVENILPKSFYTLIVLFLAAAILLFIFSVLFSDGKKTGPATINPNAPKPPPMG